MAVDYEWCCEVVDCHGDIVENYFADSLEEAWNWINDDDYVNEYQICLVRTAGDGRRSWAYLQNLRLPAYFYDSRGHDTTRVPQRFHRETERMVTR